MRVQVISDVHLEFRNYDVDELKSRGESRVESRVDLLIVAGDLMPWTKVNAVRLQEVTDALSSMAGEVVYVAGNHEYYGTSPSRAHIVKNAIDEGPRDNVHIWTQFGIRKIGGLTVAGGTMWYGGNDVMRVANLDTGTYGRYQFSDYRHISNLSPWVYEEHDDFVYLLSESKPDIVVTHHLPHPTSIHPRFAGDPSNVWFVSDQTKLIEKLTPKLWVHGHTHEAFDYVHDVTRIVANPLGYPGEKRETKYKTVVIEL